MKTLKQLSVNTSKLKEFSFCVLFGVYVAAVLWITLFSRMGKDYRAILYPFQSYIKILHGNWKACIQNIENVILFIPLGVAIGATQEWSLRKTAFYGLAVSLTIELLQLGFALGEFEFDDLLHNTLGCLIGRWLIGLKGFHFNFKRKTIYLVLFLMVLFTLMPFGCLALRYQKMVHLAAFYDVSDAIKNELILKGNSGRVGDTDIRVTYTDAGSIYIAGEAESDVWCIVSSDFILTPGEYTASVLGDNASDLIKFKLSYYDEQLGKFTWFSTEFDSCTESEFTLDKASKIRVYFRIVPGFHGECELVPVIYENIQASVESGF